jgi:hypothetical protein
VKAPGGLTWLGSGERGVAVPFSLAELEELVFATGSAAVRERMLIAIGVLDARREAALRKELTA